MSNDQVTIQQINGHVIRHEIAAFFYETHSKVITAIIQIIDGEPYVNYELWCNGKLTMYPTLVEVVKAYNKL